MRYGISTPCFGTGVDAALVADWGRAAEQAGWDGFFLWDHLFAFGPGPIDVVDPWIALTAAACSTTTIRLGTHVTPLPRRRPLMVARQTVTLDRLSGGRLVLGVGTGMAPFEWDYCGEESDHREHERAGATWWIEALNPWRYGWTEGSAWPLAAMQERIAAGP